MRDGDSGAHHCLGAQMKPSFLALAIMSVLCVGAGCASAAAENRGVRAGELKRIRVMGPVTDLAFSPNGKSLAMRSVIVGENGSKGEVEVVSVSSGSTIWKRRCNDQYA